MARLYADGTPSSYCRIPAFSGSRCPPSDRLSLPGGATIIFDLI